MSFQGTVGFIGYGNMAQAIAQGFVQAQILQPEQIVACAAHFDKLQHNAELLGIVPKHTAREVVEASDVLIVAVKPYQVREVLAQLKERILQHCIPVVSVVAGWYLDDYQALLGEVNVQCIIPNTPIAVGQAITLAQEEHSLHDEQMAVFNELFNPISLIERVDREHMHIAMSLSSCAPAFTAMYIEALGDAGVCYGLKREVAYRLAAQMIQGVGALYLQRQMHPGQMKDAVCSPGGSTIRGVAALEKHGFRASVIAAVDAIES